MHIASGVPKIAGIFGAHVGAGSCTESNGSRVVTAPILAAGWHPCTACPTNERIPTQQLLKILQCQQLLVPVITMKCGYTVTIQSSPYYIVLE